MSYGKAWNKQEVIELLKPFLQRGNSVTKACQKIGIPQSTVATWLEEDEELRLKFNAWANEINEKAREVLRGAISKGDKDTARWWLERREKEEFSTRTENINADTSLVDLLKGIDDTELDDEISRKA